MNWSIEFTVTARKDLRALSIPVRKRIISFLEERVRNYPDPRKLAKRLAGTDRELWRFRVGDYRIIAEIIEQRMAVLVITIGHRGGVYR